MFCFASRVAHAGTEYTTGSSSGIRDIGSVDNLKRESTSDIWYNYGNNANGFDFGPGNYVNGLSMARFTMITRT
jgi:hypothetical protein